MKPQTKEYQDQSLFSKCLRYTLKYSVLPFSSKENKEHYKEQFTEASRNLEITLENVLKLVRHPVKAISILKAIKNFSSNYLGSQKNIKNHEKYFVYTQLDNQIPFILEEDTMYAYTFAQFAYISNNLCKMLGKKEIKNIAASFSELNTLGAETFNKYPTLMPRFTNHNRLTLKILQKIDKPTNCCPSLHIAYSLLLDNISERKIKPKSEEIFNSIRYSTKRMFNSVLYTKQHALVDIAFGILCAKVVFEKRFTENENFNDFLSEFDSLKSEHPKINYDEIKNIYSEALDIYKNTENFPESVGLYMKNKGFIKIKDNEKME